jgi:hypothetical protein
MAYIINKTNGSKLTTVDDGAINATVCDITLLGKNYAGYGQYINENSIKLLENFANSKQPSKPITGQLWYDTSNKKLKFYNGSEFKGLPSLGIGINSDGLTKGDLWYDESRAQLFYWNGSNEELIGPQVIEQNATGILFSKVTDTLGFDHNVLLHQIQPSTQSLDVVTVAITSYDAFTLSTPNISGFSKIVQGTTFINSDPTTGVSVSGNPSVWGSSADSIRLGGRYASDYVLYANPTFAAPIITSSNSGLNIQNNNLRLYINTSLAYSVANVSSRLTNMAFSVSASEGGTLYNIFNIDATSGLRLLPSTSAGHNTDIGSSSKPFGTIYANSFVGTPAVPSMSKTGTAGSGDIGQSGNRFGTVYATTINATTNKATYADLAENYLTDAEYEPGTVLKIGGSAEVTICDVYECESVAGVVSTNPAYLMNSELSDSVAVALRGRVPCKVKGNIKKGDILVSSDMPGHAEVRQAGNTNPLTIIGRALQDFDGDIGIIEIIV